MKKHILQDAFWRTILIISTLGGSAVAIYGVLSFLNEDMPASKMLVSVGLGLTMTAVPWVIAYKTAKNINELDDDK